MVIQGGPRLIQAWMKQTFELRANYGVDIIWVTSGAIATARRETGYATKKKTETTARRLAEKQALSALGQPMVMNLYAEAIRKTRPRRGRFARSFGSQVLLTADDLANRKRRTNLMTTLSTLIAWGALPILNENDAVSTEEIQFGDNDRLSALVACHMKAERLILLTDVRGLYDADPRKYPDARLIPHLDRIRPRLIRSLSSESASGVGTGGMLSKILAGQIASRHGIITHLAQGDLPEAILMIAASTLAKSRDDAPGTTIGGFA